jgi:hypothetical protein
MTAAVIERHMMASEAAGCAWVKGGRRHPGGA